MYEDEERREVDSLIKVRDLLRLSDRHAYATVVYMANLDENDQIS